MTDRERLLTNCGRSRSRSPNRMLGGVSEAEDVVPEALLRVHQVP
jgi:hypothetical protein